MENGVSHSTQDLFRLDQPELAASRISTQGGIYEGPSHKEKALTSEYLAVTSLEPNMLKGEIHNLPIHSA